MPEKLFCSQKKLFVKSIGGFLLRSKKAKRFLQKQYKKKFDGLAVRIRTFLAKRKLNIYKKAKLLNTIK